MYTVIQTFRQTSALLLGTSILFLGTGMLYTLVVVRATTAGFSTGAIGVMQSSYQVGWLIAAMLIPFLIRRVGHIRVFAVVAALGSAVILMHVVLVDELAWIVERMVMGICTAGLMVAAESWLNDMATNRDRGKTLAMYTILSWGAPVVGVWLLRFGDINSDLFFLIASVIISLGVIPILITASRTPNLIETERFSIRQLYKITPLGVVGTFLSGLCHGGFFATVALYAAASGLGVREISNTNAIALGAGVFLQWPIALLSDRFDRRLVLACTAGLAAIPAMVFATVSDLSVFGVYFAVACMSAFLLSLYSQCVAHTNDYLKPSQIVSASGSLVLIYGIGFALTPVVIGMLLSYSTRWFFWVNGLCAAGLASFVVYRMLRREPLENQGDMVPVATASPYSTVVTSVDEWAEGQSGLATSSDYDKEDGLKP
jgi:MFS family permease